MPNWCSNTLKLRHKDPQFVARAAEAVQGSGLLGEFIPVPKDLMETVSGFFGDEDKQKELEIQQAYNLKNYGYTDWYGFCVNEWGTKWDVTGEVIEQGDDFVLCSFDSAWGPPIEAYGKLMELGFEVEAMYYEPGMAFCGEWVNGSDEEYKIEGNSEWVVENIPEHIDQEFAISEQMEQWEMEESEYDQE